VATWDDVAVSALALPESNERISREGIREWRVRDKLFAWERPLRQSDLAALGSNAPDGPILAVRVEDLGVKEILIADDPDVFFTIPHFDGYKAILILLENIEVEVLNEVVTESWLVQAPKRLAREHLAD
jgi:hypothetical protein